MSNSLQTQPEYGDEISLVDLATTFVRRRRTFYVAFAMVVLVGLIYAILLPEKYEYVTLLQSAERADGEFIEAPAATVQTLNIRWIPEIASIYAAANEQDLPFYISPSSVEGTGLIRIATEATTDLASLVEENHQALVNKVIDRQGQLLNSHMRTLESQLASIEKTIESLSSLRSGDNSSSALASVIQKRAELEGLIQSIKPAEILVVSRQSVKQKGPGKRLVLTLAIILGGLLGVVLVFVLEFMAQVRNKLNALVE